MKTLPAILVLFFAFQVSFGQKLKTPKTISQAIEILNMDCPDSLKQIIKKTANEELIKLCYPWDGEYKTVFQWTKTDNKRSKIRKHLIESGIESNKHQQTVILIAFKHYLKGIAIDEQKILSPYIKLENKWRAEDKIRSTADTLRGEYIPKDIKDCIQQIDSFWDDSTKMIIKEMSEEDFTAKVHLSFGMWMRNNWQLWSESRLSTYFNKLGIFHPDDMSVIILNSYYRHLTNQEIQLEKQIDYYQYYWIVNAKPSMDIYPKGVRKLEFNHNQLYTLSEHDLPGCVHIQTNSNSDKTWIYDYHFGWKLITKDQLGELNATTYENRESTLKDIFNK
jgi:hypothetical protein